MQEVQSLIVVPIERAQRRIDADGQTLCHSILDACKRLFISGSAHQPIVDSGIRRVESDLHTVQLSLVKLPAILLCKANSVGVEAGDKPACIADQFKEILAHCGFAACKGHLRNSCTATGIEDLFPFFRGELCLIGQSLPGGITMYALLVTVPAAIFGHSADHQIHAVRCLHKWCIFADIHIMNVCGHFFPVSDLADGRIDGIHVLLYALSGEEGYDLLYGFCRSV